MHNADDIFMFLSLTLCDVETMKRVRSKIPATLSMKIYDEMLGRSVSFLSVFDVVVAFILDEAIIRLTVVKSSEFILFP